jgi:hypothetical protein
MQNRGLGAESEFALRPRARQNGGLLQRFLQRFGEVVGGDLQERGLFGTKVTDAGIAELKKASPKCEIFFR